VLGAARSGLIFGTAILLAASCGATGDDVATDTSSAPGDAAQSSSEAGDSTTIASDTSDPAGGFDGEGGPDAEDPSTTGDGNELSTVPTTDRTVSTSVSAVAPGSGSAVSGGGGEPAIGSGPIDSGLQPYINDAVAQLTSTEGLAPSDITVQSARLVRWRDASAGCPEPGMQYLQVLTDGSAIELIAGGSTYWFHTGGRQGLFLCTSPLREAVPDSSG
jgi:hypothetical protein